MGNGKNAFGGGNKNSLYTPMSETEQEVLQRLVDSRDLVVTLKGWGHFPGVACSFGDLRLKIPLQIQFDKPDVPVPVHYFDLELRTGSGLLLFKERQSCIYGGNPILIGTGTNLSMIWDIAIKAMDPKVVKALKPGAFGLTSRWQDRDTGEMTLLGNTRMDAGQKLLLRQTRQWEAVNKLDTAKKSQAAELRAGTKLKKA
jgi:hypothetical protein